MKVVYFIFLLCLVLLYYNSVIRYLLLKYRCTDLINATVEEILVRQTKHRHETLHCSYRYGVETYVSKLQSPNAIFFKSVGEEITININPNNPKEILLFTSFSKFRLILNSIFMLPLISMFCGLTFGVGGELYSSIWGFFTNDFINRLGSILLGSIIVIVCCLGLKVLIIQPFINNIKDKEITGILEDIEVRTNDTYENKPWRKLTYRYVYDDKQYIFTSMTTDEDAKVGDEIILKVSQKKPHKAYEPYSDPLFIKISTSVFLGVFIFLGISLIIPNAFMISHKSEAISSYGSNFKDDKIDASPIYTSQCNRIEIKENVILYLPKEYKAHDSENNYYTYSGTTTKNLLILSIEETPNDVDNMYEQMIEHMNKNEKVIGDKKEFFYNNNKYFVYEVDKKDEGLDNANYVMSANNRYYMLMIIGWGNNEENPTEQILSAIEY